MLNASTTHPIPLARNVAAEAGRWEIVAQLAEELAARPKARDAISAVVQEAGDKRDLR